MNPVTRRVHVRVPATSANLGSGFDTVGLALDYHDELTFTLSDDPADTDAHAHHCSPIAPASLPARRCRSTPP